MQLDIFEHSRDVMLRSDVVDALLRRDGAAARSAWRTLGEEFRADECPPVLGVLVSALERCPAAPFANHDAARAARLELLQQIEPAAMRMLGQASGAAWLALQWAALAQVAARLPFQPDRSDEHAAPLWLRAGNWDAAIGAVSRIESWRRIPAPLGWMAEAHHRAHGLDAAWPLLVELAWLSPERFDALVRGLDDLALAALRKGFDAGYEGDGTRSDMAWFPAWVLTVRPALAPRLNEANPSHGGAPQQAIRLVVELLRLERDGRHRELIERRKALRAIGAALYAAYMKTR